MNSGIDSLHKILKDETRRKIVLLLNEKQSLGYTDLMNNLGIVNTGILNYHLKVLGDLLTKDEAGQYLLTQKGKLASKLLIEFPEPDIALQAKKKGWKRFWIAATVLNTSGFLFIFSLTAFGYLSLLQMAQGIFGFATSMIFLYFFYRMIRPVARTKTQNRQVRTIQDLFVYGRQTHEIIAEIHSWVNEEGIEIEVEREGFVRGRLGTPSGLGLTAPKYFEVSFKPNQNSVAVHTEGWVSVFDVSERGFSKTSLTAGGIPRRKGWVVMEHLWQRLKSLSK
jgi:hypothetical protein